MAGTLNKVMLIGHLGDEIKMHYFEGGNALGRFPIATNETYLNRQTNEKTTTTEWHNIVVKNKLAQLCEQYLTKGDKVYVEGKIKTRQWDDQSGTKHYATEIHATEITFLSDKKGQNQTSSTAQITPQTNQSDNIPDIDPDDDLPF